MWMQGSTYAQPQHQDEAGWLVLRSAAFTPEEISWFSFYRRLSGPQDQSGHEGLKKNLKSAPPPTPGIETGPSSPRPSALLLELPGPLRVRVPDGYYFNLVPTIILKITKDCKVAFNIVYVKRQCYRRISLSIGNIQDHADM